MDAFDVLLAALVGSFLLIGIAFWALGGFEALAVEDRR